MGLRYRLRHAGLSPGLGHHPRPALPGQRLQHGYDGRQHWGHRAAAWPVLTGQRTMAPQHHGTTHCGTTHYSLWHHGTTHYGTSYYRQRCSTMAILTTGGDARADAGDRDASLRRAGLARGRGVGGTQPTRAR
eukprot:scaffold49253_cov58-Phaeocystis_antarctica.AAC.4